MKAAALLVGVPRGRRPARLLAAVLFPCYEKAWVPLYRMPLVT
jgi:hypothetical protein